MASSPSMPTLRSVCAPMADLRFRMDSEGKDRVDLRLQDLPRQAVARDPVAQHPAELLALFENRHLMPHQAQIVGRAQAAGSAADDGHVLSGRLRTLRQRHFSGTGHGKALQPTDVDRVVHHAAAALNLAGMLADQAADGGHGIILPDEPDGVGIASLQHAGDIAGDVHTRRAHGNTGHRLIERADAAPAADVLLKVVTEALESPQDHPRGLVTNGAVCGQEHRQDVLQQLFQLCQSDAAGYALAAGLRAAHFQKGSSQIDRAQARLGGDNTPLHVLV